MTATYLGSVTVGGAMPGAAAVGAAASAGLGGVLPDLVSRLESFAAWQPAAIDLTAQLATLQAMIAGINAQIALGVSPPSLDAQLDALRATIAALQAQVTGLEVQLAIVADFQAALGAAGVHLIAFEGTAAAFGPEVGARLGSVAGVGPADACRAITFLTTSPAAWAALASILKVTP